MFSDHLPKKDPTSGKKLFLIAGGLVIVGQLVAMVLVTQGQVEKAQAREVTQASQRTATAWCMETSRGAELRGCAASSANGSASSTDYASVLSANRY